MFTQKRLKIQFKYSVIANEISKQKIAFHMILCVNNLNYNSKPFSIFVFLCNQICAGRIISQNDLCLVEL